jgi:peptidoglycan/xylan/chitin deacetylase (PgdA/CDA1 family)
LQYGTFDNTNPNPEPAGARRLHLLYHELRPSGSAYSYVVDTDAFDRHLAFYASLQSRPTASLRPAITFDDGHISNYEFALPRLSALGLKAHFFITAGWTETKPGYMGWKELRALHADGQIIGGHGWSHTLLTHCDPAQLDHELRTTRLTLEDKLGAAVTTMSLPGGRYNSQVMAACRKAGYTQIFTSVPQAETVPLGETVGRLNIRGDMTEAWIEGLFDADSVALAKLGRQYRIKETAKRWMGDKLYAKLWSLLNREEPEATQE